MPTVPIVFTFANRQRRSDGSVVRPGNPWNLRGGTLHDGDGNPISVVASGKDGIYDLGPFSFDFDPAVIWGPGAHKESADPSYFEAQLTYPDDWHETYFSFEIRVNNYITTSEFGWVAYYDSTVLGDNQDFIEGVPALVQPDPEITELLPCEQPMALWMKLGEEAVDPVWRIRGFPPIFEYEAGSYNGEGVDNYCVLRNRSLSPMDASGTISVDWGGGDVDTYSFSYTLPPSSIELTFNPSATPQYWVTRVPYLRICTDADITSVSAATVIIDNVNHYVAEIRIPRGRHDYTSLHNTDPTIWAETSQGNTWHLKRDPRPIANFGPVGDDDLSDLDTFRLDASRSFDLTDDVGLWLWYWQRYEEGHTAPTGAPVGIYSKVLDTPILEVPDMEDGLYLVVLRVAVGHLVDGGPAYEIERNSQISYTRRKQVHLGAGRFGSLIDAHGTLYTAVNEQQNVVVSRFKTGTGSREILSTIPDAKNPSIYKNANNHIRMGYTSRSSGDFVTATSTDDGKVFS